MAELSIKKGDGDKGKAIVEPQRIEQPALLGREWLHPLRAMRDLLRWDPFAQILPVPTTWERQVLAPDFDVRETKNEFIFKADVPGLEDKDIDVRVTQNRLTITGSRDQEKTEKGDTFYTYERAFGSFTRAFTLPDGVDIDRINAELENGVLTLSVPKKAEARSKQIPVKS